MAISQNSLAEEGILSRQERAVLRGVYRASQLAEGKVLMSKALNALTTDMNGAYLANVNTDNKAKYASIEEYFNRAIVAALVSTKVPAVSSASTDLSKQS